MKKTTFIAGTTIIIWLSIGAIGNLSTLELTNLSFITGIIFLMVYAVVNIIQSNFLTLFLNGFKKIQFVVFPQSRSSKRAEMLIGEDIELNEWKSSMQKFFKQFSAAISISTLLVSLVSLVMYY